MHQKETSSAVNFTKNTFCFIERCRKGDSQILTNNISSFSLFRKKVVLIPILKKSNIQHNKWEKTVFVDSFSRFGNQREGL